MGNAMNRGKEYTGVTVVFFCHDGEGNFVFSKRSKNCRDEHGRWDCGGGGLEVHDTVENTLKKEIREELGTDPVGYEFLGFRDVHRGSGEEKTHWIALDFKALVDKAKVINNEPHKFDEIGWFRLNDLPEPLHSQLPGALRQYKEKL